MNKQLLRVGGGCAGGEPVDDLPLGGRRAMEGTKIGRGSLRVFRDSLDRLVQSNKTHEMNLSL